MKRSARLRVDPVKAREWQQRGRDRYEQRRRDAARNRSPKQQKRKPRRNDSQWRADVIALRGGHCRRCGTDRGVQCDHVMPRSQGGPSVVENGTMLCRDCHQQKTEKAVRYERSWLDPDQIAWLAEQGWVWWDDDGHVWGRGRRGFNPTTPTPTPAVDTAPS